MDPSLSVVVQVDPGGSFVHLLVTGSLTEATQRQLPDLVGRARTLVPGATVNVDLSAAHHVEPAALAQLQRSLDHDHDRDSGGPVRVLTHPAPFWSPAEPSPPALLRSTTRAWAARHRDGVAA